MDKFEEIQQMWEQVNQRLDRLDTSIVDESARIATSNIKSARRRLLRRDKIMIFYCFICAGVFPIGFALVPATEDGIVGLGVGYWRIVTVSIMLIYFLLCAFSTIYLYLKVQDINLMSMSIEEIAERTREIKKCHLRIELVNLTCAVLVLCELFYVLSIGNRWLLIPGLIGLIIGLSIGLPLFFRYMADYRKMIYPYNEGD